MFHISYSYNKKHFKEQKNCQNFVISWEQKNAIFLMYVEIMLSKNFSL